MTHDIAHCDGGNCPQKERCHRYLAHLEAVRLKLKFITYITPERDCSMFWEDKAYDALCGKKEEVK